MVAGRGFEGGSDFITIRIRQWIHRGVRERIELVQGCTLSAVVLIDMAVKLIEEGDGLHIWDRLEAYRGWGKGCVKKCGTGWLYPRLEQDGNKENAWTRCALKGRRSR